MRVIENKKATETHELDRFMPSVRRNTLLLWSVGLYWLSYDVACVWRGSLPALYSLGGRVTSRLDLRDIRKVITDYRNHGIIRILTDLMVYLGYLPGVLRESPSSIVLGTFRGGTIFNVSVDSPCGKGRPRRTAPHALAWQDVRCWMTIFTWKILSRHSRWRDSTLWSL